MTDQVQSAGRPGRSGAVHEAIEMVRTVVYALLIALVLRTLLFQPFTIPSGSMEPTLLEGDYVIVAKTSYGYSGFSIPLNPPLIQGRVLPRAPHRGDIVVFKLPRDHHFDYVKRLVGLPGDRLQVIGGVLLLNGVAVPRKPLEPVLVDSGYGFTRSVQRYEETLPGGPSYVTYDYGPDGRLDNTGVFVVPAGHYFMMGDNRDNSLDSRVPASDGGVGFVPFENLEGKAQLIMLSWSAGASILKPWTWFMDIRLGRFFNRLT
jgi:signal peptidase I